MKDEEVIKVFFGGGDKIPPFSVLPFQSLSFRVVARNDLHTFAHSAKTDLQPY